MNPTPPRSCAPFVPASAIVVLAGNGNAAPVVANGDPPPGITAGNSGPATGGTFSVIPGPAPMPNTRSDLRHRHGRRCLQAGPGADRAQPRLCHSADARPGDGRRSRAFVEHERPRGRHVVIDHFFRTLAGAHRERAIGIVLSGTGADGSVGIARLKEAGGIVIAQAPGDAEYDGMPQSAIATGKVDIVLPVADILARLVEVWSLAPAAPQ